MKKRILTVLSVSALLVGASFALAYQKEEIEKVEGYTTSSLPTTIDLNDTSEENIRDYYSELNSLVPAQRQGDNLLINLKPILKNGQKYYAYDDSNAIWQMYEITDRDWKLSPASSTTYGTYNSAKNIITNYKYGSNSDGKNNPYIHALYINRNIDNQVKAWGNHNQDDWGINREHVWAKNHGFKTKESGSAGGARGDPMHLIAANGYANNLHSDDFYGYVDTTKSYTDAGSKYETVHGNLSGKSLTLNGAITVFEPQDCDKGDIARAVFYMAARYNYLSGSDSDPIDSNNPNLFLSDDPSDVVAGSSTESNSYAMGIMSDLLEWNRLDPPDEYEIHRNNLLYTNYTNNRNPFIDFPDWADIIWGDKKTTTSANPASDTISAFGGETTIVNVESISLPSTATIAVGETLTLNPAILPTNATDKSVTWHTSDSTKATVSNKGVVIALKETAENATVDITAVTNDGQLEATCSITITKEIEPESSESSDTLNLSFTGVSGSTYSDWDNKTGSSGTIYKGNSAGGNSSIQLRTEIKDSKYSGIVSTKSVGNIKKVIVDWNSNTSDARILSIYGSNTAYSSTSDLYSSETYGTLLGEIAKATSTELTISGNYKYIGIKSKKDAMYLNSIQIEWDIPVTSVDIEQNEVELDLNGSETTTLTCTVLPANATDKSVSWSSSDTDIATVSSSGVVTAKAVGETTITATSTSGSLTDTCDITVIDTTEPEIPEEDIVTSSTISAIATLNSWENGQTYASFLLDDNITIGGKGAKYYTNGNNWRLYQTSNSNLTVTAATGFIIKDISITFTISNTGALTDSNSNNLVSSQPYEVNDQSIEFTVTNTGSATNGQVKVTGISVTYSYIGGSDPAIIGISVSSTLLKFYLNGTKTATLTANVSAVHGASTEVTWSSDDETVATVDNGVVEAKKVGSTTIKATSVFDNSFVAECAVTVSETDLSSSPYVNGQPYKLYFVNTSTSKTYYFNGQMGGNNNNYGATSEAYAEGVSVYFEKNGDGQNLYFYTGEEPNQTKQYIYAQVNGNSIYFRFGESIPSQPWLYSTDENEKCIYMAIGTKRCSIGTFNNYSTFAGFDLDAHPEDYKPQFALSAEVFSYYVINKIGCDSTGVNAPNFESGYSWTELKTIYNSLYDGDSYSSEKEILKNWDAKESSESIIERALAKYEYLVAKYGYEDFLERNVQPLTNSFVNSDINSNSSITIAIIVGTLITLSIGLGLSFRKRKED